jgi:hypothetical protein
MPRTLRPLALAAIVGSALTLGVIGLMSMAQSPTNMLDHVVVGYGPAPRDMVVIKEGSPYTVPGGRTFVLTGLGDISGCTGGTALYVDSQEEERAGVIAGVVASASTVSPVPTGFAVSAGHTISLTAACGTNAGRAWGYLANE